MAVGRAALLGDGAGLGCRASIRVCASPTLVAATERMYSAWARRAGEPVARADATMRSIHSNAVSMSPW